MKQVEVQIMGQGYLLSSPDDGQSVLLEAVRRVDAAMCKVRDAGKVKTRDRIAVLASLNLAVEMAELALQLRQTQANLQAALAAVAPPAVVLPASPPHGLALPAHWADISRRLDEVLAEPQEPASQADSGT